MRNRLFWLVLYASLIQQILFWTMKEEIPKLCFFYGVPLTRQVTYHTMMFGYWFLPIFFVVYYFSGYFSYVDGYEMAILIRYRKRSTFFWNRLCSLIRELTILVGMQLLIGIGADFASLRLLGARGGFLYDWKLDEMIVCLMNYFVVMLIIILLQNLLDMYLESTYCCNAMVNVFIIISVFVYNFHSSLRSGIFRLVNIAMHARMDVQGMEMYFCMVLIICGMIGGMRFRWKKMSLLGGKNRD